MACSGKQALTCAGLSDLAYRGPHQIRRQIKRIAGIIGIATVAIRTIPHRNSRILVVTDSSAIYVVFRGTVMTSWPSWKANLTVTRTRWMNGKVHKGFLGLLNQARSFFKPKLAQISSRGKPIYFTGHSQGGAVAFLAAMDNIRLAITSRKAENFTFGQPRTGNKHFCRNAETRLRGNCHRIVNGRDLVVGVPFVLQGYDHIRDYLHYGVNQTIIRRRQAPGAGWLSASVKDHSIANYLNAAQKNVHVTV